MLDDTFGLASDVRLEVAIHNVSHCFFFFLVAFFFIWLTRNFCREFLLRIFPFDISAVALADFYLDSCWLSTQPLNFCHNGVEDRWKTMGGMF